MKQIQKCITKYFKLLLHRLFPPLEQKQYFCHVLLCKVPLFGKRPKFNAKSLIIQYAFDISIILVKLKNKCL